MINNMRQNIAHVSTRELDKQAGAFSFTEDVKAMVGLTRDLFYVEAIWQSMKKRMSNRGNINKFRI